MLCAPNRLARAYFRFNMQEKKTRTERFDESARYAMRQILIKRPMFELHNIEMGRMTYEDGKINNLILSFQLWNGKSWWKGPFASNGEPQVSALSVDKSSKVDYRQNYLSKGYSSSSRTTTDVVIAPKTFNEYSFTFFVTGNIDRIIVIVECGKTKYEKV